MTEWVSFLVSYIRINSTVCIMRIDISWWIKLLLMEPQWYELFAMDVPLWCHALRWTKLWHNGLTFNLSVSVTWPVIFKSTCVARTPRESLICTEACLMMYKSMSHATCAWITMKNTRLSKIHDNMASDGLVAVQLVNQTPCFSISISISISIQFSIYKCLLSHR